MDIFDVYKLWDIEPVRAKGYKLWDKDGVEYTDFYGGHAVISIGHSHPTYNDMLSRQLSKLGFYSNAVLNPLQRELADILGKSCGYGDYSLFLCNSGAEANENALKLASFHTGKSKILSFRKSFHGRTSGAVATTDNPSIQAPFNATGNVVFSPFGDLDAVEKELQSNEFAGVIIEGIQGVAGIYVPDDHFLQGLRLLCNNYGAVLILDEVQSGYGRTGQFFAHSHSGIRADIITTAKGMGNGFPIGGVLISPSITPRQGMLGTTFGGNHLACTAAIAVLKIINGEHLIENAAYIGEYLIDNLKKNNAISEVRGRGLMIGLEIKPEYEGLRDRLLFEKHYFTGGAGKNVIRLLPPLSIGKSAAEGFINAFNELTT